MSEFSDRPFVAGSVFGVRSFRIDKGALTGVVHRVPWTAQMNEARCIDVLASFAAMGMSFETAMHSLVVSMHNLALTLARHNGKVYLRKAPKPPAHRAIKERPASHRSGSVECRCGFYAYFDGGFNPHHAEGQVLGIIEGFGLVSVGSRGFRAEKARIVALVAPAGWTSSWRSVKRNYRNVPVFASLDAALACFPVTNETAVAA